MNNGQFLSDIGAELRSAIDDLVARSADSLDITVRLRTNRLAERCRRHLEGLTLKSTYNADRVKALSKTLADLRQEYAPLIKEVVMKRLLIDIAEQELQSYLDAEERLHQERAVRAATGMYAEPARLIDLLFTDKKVDRGDFAALTDDDVDAIARILRKSSAPLRTQQVRDDTIKKASKR